MDIELRKERLWALEERRFTSTRIQIESVTDLGDSVSSILEVGPGSGYFTTFTKGLGYSVKTADIKPWSNPDYLGDVRELDIEEKFDLVAAFEVLQHLPYSELVSTLEKLAALSNRYVLISVPARTHRFGFSIEIPDIITPRRLGLGWLRGQHSFSIKWEWPRAADPNEREWVGRDDYWNPHYWEVGRKSYPRSRVFGEIESAGLRILWARYNPQFSYHLFALTEKVGT
jgi:hypothetical protein